MDTKAVERLAEASAEDKTGFKHRGWSVWHDADRPATGVWRAERFGVGMCAGLRSQIVRMIDDKAKEQPSATLPNSGVVPLAARTLTLPLQDGKTYRDGWSDTPRTVGGTTKKHPELVWTIQGDWYERATGRAARSGILGAVPTNYDLCADL